MVSVSFSIISPIPVEEYSGEESKTANMVELPQNMSSCIDFFRLQSANDSFKGLVKPTQNLTLFFPFKMENLMKYFLFFHCIRALRPSFYHPKNYFKEFSVETIEK